MPTLFLSYLPLKSESSHKQSDSRMVIQKTLIKSSSVMHLKDPNQKVFQNITRKLDSGTIENEPKSLNIFYQKNQ